MALSSSRLSGTLATHILAQLQVEFPIPNDLLTAEKNTILAYQTSLANALAAAIGPDVVTEVKLATVTVSGSAAAVTSGPSTAVVTGTATLT